jgi:hypothetical protein
MSDLNGSNRTVDRGRPSSASPGRRCPFPADLRAQRGRLSVVIAAEPSVLLLSKSTIGE